MAFECPRKRSGLAPAAFIDPRLPTRVEKAPTADGWVHEINHDGFRLQIHARKGRMRLYTMTGVDWSDRYPWIVRDVARLNIDHAIIDAECCCDGENGLTDFNRLQARVYDASAYAYAFDLLAIDGTDTRALPLSERKAALAKLLRKAKPGIRYSEHLDGKGPRYSRKPAGWVWKASCRRNSPRHIDRERQRHGSRSKIRSPQRCCGSWRAHE